MVLHSGTAISTIRRQFFPRRNDQMKRLVILTLSALILTLAGCEFLADLLVQNLFDDRPKRRPGWSDARYEAALEERRINKIVREFNEREYED